MIQAVSAPFMSKISLPLIVLKPAKNLLRREGEAQETGDLPK
jgi:hypothetical protein